MALRTLTISSYTPLHQLFVFAAAGGTTSSISTRTCFPAHLGGSHLLQRLPREPRKKMRRLSLLVFGFLASLSGGAALGAGDGEKGRGEIWSLEAEQSGDSNTVPAFPVVEQGKEKCHLDLSDELFGDVKEACGDGKQLLDRSRCCPVLAAWLYAAHARTALKAISPPVLSSYLQPLLPDDSQTSTFSSQSNIQGIHSQTMADVSSTVPSIVVYVTVPNKEEGRKLAQSIIKEKLAGCVNQVPGIESTYWWKDKIETDSEELLIIKTRQSLLEALTAHVKANHPYEVPEVISLPITGGNHDYLKWLKESTRE